MEATLGFKIDSSPAANAAVDLDRLTIAAGRTEQAVGRAEGGFDALGSALRKVGEGAGQAKQPLDEIGRSFGSQDAHIQAFRTEIDRLTMKFDPLAKAQRSYVAALSEIQAAHRLGVIDAGRMSKLIDDERIAFDRLRASAEGASIAVRKAANSNGLSEGNKRFIGRDLAFQGQDIVTTALGGMSPQMIAAQRGSQIAGALSGLSAKQAGGALLGAVGNLLNPLGLATIAFTGLAAAGIQALTSTSGQVKSLDDALKSSADSVDALKDRFGALAKVQVSLTSVGGSSFIVSNARQQLVDLQKSIDKQLKNAVSSTNNAWYQLGSWGGSGIDAANQLQNLTGDQAEFNGPVATLIAQIKAGHGDLNAFNKDVNSLYDTLASKSKNLDQLRSAADAVQGIANAAFSVSGKFAAFAPAINMLKVEGSAGVGKFADEVHRLTLENPALAKLGDELISKSKEIVDAAQQAKVLAETLNAIDREDTRPGLRDREDLTKYVAQRSVAQRRLEEQFAADQQMTRARTFPERLAAVRAQSLAQHPANADEGGGAAARADRAVQAEQLRQQLEITDSQKQRAITLDRLLNSQREELSLIGLTGGAAEGLRQQYQMIAEIREEAARRGVPADEAEIAGIQAKTAALSRYIDATNLAKANDDLDFQDRQFGRTPQQQQIAQQLRQYGQSEDLNSELAKRLQSNMQRNALKNQIDAFSSDFSSNLLNRGSKIGEALGDSIMRPLCGPAFVFHITLPGENS